MPMWGSRFREALDPGAQRFNASIGFDRRLAAQDVRASAAWARALRQAGVLTAGEADEIVTGLEKVGREFDGEAFAFQPDDEDVHSAVERRLTELIGAPAGKLHTGRSRNDQVATDLRLWLMDHLPPLDAALANLQAVLMNRAQTELEMLMPGYTHLQRAQPITLGHWWLSHVWPLQRDRQRLRQARASAAQLPLGSGALAGTSFPVDRMALAADLGFRAPCPNSIDAVADRDFAAEFIFAAALIGIHLSRLADAVILFSTREFGFFELHDAFSTGSSLMPQKKNPDVLELTRARSGALMGDLAGLLATLKGLPSAYDKDLQEDKPAVFHAYDTLAACLPVVAGVLRSLTVHPERMAAAIDDDLLAVDLADHLVLQGVPFRQAHEVVGRWVRLALDQGRSLRSFSLAELQVLHAAFTQQAFEFLDATHSVGRRRAIGGTAPASVAEQLAVARQASQSLAWDLPLDSTHERAGGRT
ncbi:MAG TPA: argininosuccinate lyase [Anaerolineales bacterium]|nr:argininosuccinate lyase [Anaerolineales bacterium]